MKTRKLRELPYNPNLKQRARELRKAGNILEVKFWLHVKNKQFHNLDFDRQRVIGNYIVDFYCHELLLIIEFDGSSHDNKVEYDAERNNYLSALGLKILHINASEVEFNIEGVLRHLEEFVENL